MKWLAIAGLAVLSTAVVAAGDDFKRERGRDNDAKKNSLEGKAPPKFVSENWMNIGKKEALTWKDLKGKVVVLDFWGVW